MLSKPIFFFLLFVSLGAFLQADGKAFLGLDLEKNDAGQAVVIHVLEGQAAEKGGVKPGDILVAVNGQKFRTLEEMAKLIHALAPGDKGIIHVIRDQKLLELEIVFGSAPVAQKKSTAPKTKRNLGVYVPVQISVKDATLEEVLNQIFEKSNEHVQYIALADSVLRRRLTLSVKDLGAIYAAQYACVVADVPFRTQMLNNEKILFIIYPFWTENKSKETTSDKKQTEETSPSSFSGKRAYIGLDLAETLTEEDKKSFGQSGALILDVVRFSPAEKAGLKKEDLLIAVGDTVISSPKELLEKLTHIQPKEKAIFTVIRGKEKLEFSVVFADDPRFSGLLHQEMKLRYDATNLGDILDDLHSYSQEKFQFVASNEVLTRYRFSLRVSGIHLQLLLSHFLNLIDWEYEIIQSSPTNYLMLITRPKSKG